MIAQKVRRMSEIDKFLDGDTPKPVAPAKAAPPSSQIDDFLKDAPAPARGLKGWGQDIAATAVKGAIAVPEALVGLADIPTGGAVGKFLENEGGSVGFRPKQAREIANDWHSDATKQAQRKFQDADGVLDKTAVALQNPSLIATAVGESLPSMGLGGVAARGLMAATRLGQMGAKGAVLAGAAGEGATMAGSAAEQIRQETDDGLLTPGQAGLALSTGVAGGAFGYAGGKLAQRLGIGDADTMLAQGIKGMDKQFADTAARSAANPLVAEAAIKSIPRKVIEGAIAEGFLEELPQSMAEQIFQNIALGKDWHEELDSAAVMGVLSGGAMGAGAAGFHGFRSPSATHADDVAPAPGADPAAPAAEAAPQQNLGLARVSSEFAARLQELQEQEEGDSQGLQSATTYGDAVLAQQQVVAQRQAQEQAVRDAQMAESRAVESPDDEIYQSTGATAPRPSEAMGLRTGPDAGPLENAAALSVDTGATAQMQQAAVLAEAAEAAQKAKPETQKQERQAKAQQQEIDQETGEILNEPTLADWSDADLSMAFRNAQSKDVRLQLANELSRRRAEREEDALQEELRDEQAAASMPDAPDNAFARTQEDAGPVPKNIEIQDDQAQTVAPGANAEGANVATLAQLNRKKLAEMTDDELQQLSSLLPADHSRQQKIQKAIQDRAAQAQAAINQGAEQDGKKTDQAQQAIAQPAQAGAAQAGQPAAQGLTEVAPHKEGGYRPGDTFNLDGRTWRVEGAAHTGNAVTAATDDGGKFVRRRMAVAAPQAQAQELDRQQRAKRLDDAGAQWTRMPAAERSALVGRLEGVKPVLAKNMPKAEWGKLNADVQGKLADAMGTTPAQDSKASKPENQFQSEPEWWTGRSEDERRLLISVTNRLSGNAFANATTEWDSLSSEQKTFMTKAYDEYVSGGASVGPQALTKVVVRNGGKSSAPKPNQPQAKAQQAQTAIKDVAIKSENQPQDAPATHADPGQTPEAATPAVVAESLQKAARNEDTKPSEMRKWLVAEIDKELLQAPDRADYDEAVKRMGEKDAISMFTGNGLLGKNSETGFITFDVPGDGKYKVRNSVRGLLEFRKNVMASSGFKDGGQKQVKPKQNDGVQGGSGGRMAAITNMIEEGDFEAARDYAEAVGIKLEDVKVPRGDMKPAWEKYLKDGALPPAPDTRPQPAPKTAAQLDEDVRQEADADASEASYRELIAEMNAKIGERQTSFDAEIANLKSQHFRGTGVFKGLRSKKAKDEAFNDEVRKFRLSNEGDQKAILDEYRAKIDAHPYEAVRRAEGARMTREIKAQMEADAARKAAQPITRADVEAAQQQAAAIIGERIDAMSAGDVNKIAKKFLPTMGIKPTMSKANNKAAMTDTKINLEAAAAEVGATLPAEVTRALQADMEGRVVDAQVDAAEQPTKKLTHSEAKSLMEWQDLGQKDGVKTHALTFYESQADKDAKRGRMIVARVSKGDRSATAWMVDGEDKTFGMLAQAKKRAEEVGMAKAVADGFVAEHNPFAEYNALAKQYGYEVRPDGAIGSGGKFPGPTIKVKGGRLRIESGSGDLLASYAGTSPDSLGKFLESFWYAEKKADGFVEPAAAKPAAQSPIERAKAVGIKGLRADMSDETLRQRVKSYLAGERAARLIAAGKQTNLHQYQGVSEKDARTLGALVESNPYGVNTSGEQWVFDARGVTTADALVQGGLLKPDNGNYKHELTPVGKEIARKALRSPIGDASIGDMLTELEESKPKTGNGAMFSRKATAMEDRNLVVVHNLSASNLMHAEELGGLAVPSLAIARVDAPLDGFGEITLVGDSAMATPGAKNPVFDADVYSPRFPSVSVKVNEKVVRDALAPLMDAASAAGLHARSPASSINEMKRNRLFGAIDQLSYDAGLRLGFANAVQKKALSVPMRDVAPKPTVNAQGSLAQQSPLMEYLANVNVGQMKKEDSAELAQKVYAALFNRTYARFEAESPGMANAEMFDKVITAINRRIGMFADTTIDQSVHDLQFENVGLMHGKGLLAIHNLQRNTDTATAPVAAPSQEVDYEALRELLDAEVPRESFNAWLRENLTPAMGERRVEKENGRTAAYTLENIVREMTRKVRDSEGFNYGLGNARSKGATKFKNLRQIQGQRDRVVPSEQFEAARKELEAEFKALTEAVTPFQRYESDSAFELLAEAIGNSYTMPMERSLEQSALIGVPEALRNRISAFGAALVNAPTEYFEAKPQRAVQFNEFRGAVIPSDTTPEVREVLERSGLQLQEYKRGDAEGRRAAVGLLAEQLNADNGDVLFSRSGNNGNFDPANPDIRYSRMDDNAATEGVSNEQRQTPSGIPAGLPATSDPDSQYLERQINNWLQTSGWRADRISAVSLPIELRTALDRFTDTTGTRVVLFRNLTPEIEDFNGVNFRDGRVFINETSQHPATLTAAHEWVHNLKRTNPELYQLLEDEVRDQGRIPEWHQRNTQEEGQDRGIDHAVEELTAAAVSDAMTDPAFLEQLAQRNQSVFRRVARAFLDFLDSLTAGWRDQGSNAYLRDVQAFRDKLADVLDRLPATGQGTANFAANPARRPGTAQDKAVMQAIADGKTTRDVLRLIASGSKDPFLRQVARLLLKAGITPNIQFGHIGKTKKGDPIHGQYRGESDTIAIAGSAEYAAERIFMHEAMHAATMRALAKPGLPRLQLQKLLEHVRKQPGAAGFYGTKNVDEFVAEVFTNPDFQAALRKMNAPSESSGIKTAWDGFVRILRSILGLKNDPNNALSQALELGVAAVREDMGLRKRADRASLRLRGDVVAAAGVTPLQLRVQTVEWAKQRWSEGSGGQAEVVRNTDPRFGKDVRIAWQGVKHAIAGANQPELRLIPHVAKIMQSAKYLRSEDDRANRAHIKKAHFFEANVVLDGERLLVGMVVHEKADGQMFYDQFIVSKARDQKDAPPHGTSGNGMPGISDRSVLQPSSGGGSIVGQGMDSGQDGVANFGVDDIARIKAISKDVGDGLKAVTVPSIKKTAGHKFTDWLKIGLQFLGRRQLVEIYGKDIPMDEYNRLVAQMEADKNDIGAGADELVRRWGKLQDEAKLANLMHDATLAQIDADSEVGYEEGDDKLQSAMLKGQFKALSSEAKNVYREARDSYREHHTQVRKAIKDRIIRSELSSEKRAELLKKMDDEFFQKVKGVYFPLARFGQYVVAVKNKDGQVVSVSRAETMPEADAMRVEMVKAFPAADGYDVGRVTLSKEFVASHNMVGRGFMTDLYQSLEKLDIPREQLLELEDTLGQLYLSSLPDLSWAKHGIHRKGTPGFSQDARRAFAQNTFHGARYLAKLRYGDLMQDELDRMQKHVDEWGVVDADFDQPRAQRVVDEMAKRHDTLMNPQSNPLSTALTSAGFLYYLGLSPAAAAVNLSQTALVAYPIMAGKWGYKKTADALMRASNEVVRSKNDMRSALSDKDEIAAYDEAVRIGAIDVTMAHDLAGIAQGEDSKVMWKIRPVMRMASFLFHHAERFNRQATFIAAYRLARDTGIDHKAAFSQAVQATYDGHFDYGSANRPRVMQGNVARVVLLFKQYAQNMIFTLARQAYQSVAGETPKVRSEARKVFAGLLVTHASAAGVLGLPLVGPLLAVASALGGDDDEPWDAEVALRNMLADVFGPKASEVVARGLSRLGPWDISGRVGLDKLILPDVQEGLEGQRWAEQFATGMLGPVIGMGVNAARGAQKLADGDYGRALEDILPVAARNPIKAGRYMLEGAQDKSGIAIKDEVSMVGAVGQFIGFSPSEVRLAFEGKAAVMDADRKMSERRQELLTKIAKATMAKDENGKAEAREEIKRFNEKNPGRRINPNHIMQSVRNRQKRIDQAQDGVYLPKNRRDAMDAGRFAFEQ